MRALVHLLLDLVYFCFVLLVSPILLWRILVRGKYWGTLRERMGALGHLPRKTNCIWVHGVSVGEVKTARPLVTELGRLYPQAEIVVSATSRAGKTLAAELYPDCTVVSFPLDFSWAVRRYLEHFRPALVVLMELELWANFLLYTRQRDIPVVLVNGRLSEKSFRGYSRYLRRVFPWMTRGVRRFAMQADIYAERLERLGVSKDRIVVTGSMKFDVAPQHDADAERTLARECGIRPEHKVLIAGSTHPSEERMLLKCYQQLIGDVPELRLVLGLRHVGRAHEVSELIRQEGLAPILRSDAASKAVVEPADNCVVVVDTMGELGKLYALGHIVVIGGSLVPDGGHNFIEPAALGKAIICGPSMYHFPEAQAFFDERAMVRLKSAEDLGDAILHLLQAPGEAEAMGTKAAELVRRNQGTTQRNLRVCMEALPPEYAKADEACPHEGPLQDCVS